MKKKVYTATTVGIATYLSGPLAGFYMISKNFSDLGYTEKAKSHLLYGVLCTVALFTALFFTPSSIFDLIPSFLLPLIYVLLIQAYMKHTQNDDIQKLLAGDGVKYSMWNVIGVVIVSLLLSLLFFIALAYLIPA